jgi:outer membrane PBP1 activator LpoA protein
VINADENVLQGWLDLQQMWFNNRNDPNMLKAGITDWQTRYPQNPGAKMLPTQLVNVQNFKPASTSKIALLLPLNGQAAVFGRTIQQGFEAAKNGTRRCGSAVPAQAAQAANVNMWSALRCRNQRSDHGTNACAGYDAKPGHGADNASACTSSGSTGTSGTPASSPGNSRTASTAA